MSLGVRSIVSRPSRLAALIGAQVTAGLAIAIALILVGTIAQRTGSTNLAIAVTEAVLPQDLAIMVVIGFGALAITTLLWTLELREQSARGIILRSVGWSRREIDRVALATVLLVAVPAVISTAVATALLAPIVSAGGPVAGAAAGTLTALILAAVVAVRSWIPARQGVDA